MLPRKIKRKIKRVYVKLIGSKDSVYSSSMGVAIGMFCSVAIPLFQFVLAIILAFLTRSSKTLAVIFTFFSNPYTTPFLYTAACLLGANILGLDLTMEEIKTSFIEIYSSFSFEAITHIGWKLFISYMVGGPIIGAVFGFVSYFISTKLIITYQKKRAARRVERINSRHRICKNHV